MTGNIHKIRAGMAQLARQPWQIIWGTVVPGSYDAVLGTVGIQPLGQTEPIDNVLINAVPGEEEGMTLVPTDNSYVVTGAIEGSGQWVILKAGEVDKAEIKRGNVTLTVDASGIQCSKGDTVVKVNNKVEISAAGENLHGLLKDLLAAIKVLTVPTPVGTSGVPVNLADFVVLEMRIDNLLQA
jgi:hypothetical protein